MTSSKNLSKMARKWQKLASIKKKRITADNYRASLVADKGHFFVYTADKMRLMVPLVCLNSEIFRELLKLSEDEFGLPCEGPITLPCDAFFVEYAVSLVDQDASRDLEIALLLSVLIPTCSQRGHMYI